MARPHTPLPKMTVEEYFAFDAAAPEGVRYEYWDGYVVPQHGWDETGTVAMAGASPEHNRITSNLGRLLLEPAYRRGCYTAMADGKVRMPSGRYVLPDFVAACDAPEFDEAQQPAALVNPTFVVEVASSSTSARDRGEKLQAYTALPSLQEYWIVEQDQASVTRVVRRADGWRLGFATGLDAALRCEALDLEVALADVYALVDLGAN